MGNSYIPLTHGSTRSIYLFWSIIEGGISASCDVVKPGGGNAANKLIKIIPNKINVIRVKRV
jgi:hypothetical protein